jgi:hypothetical protein
VRGSSTITAERPRAAVRRTAVVRARRR